MPTAEENDLLCRVEGDAPMGQLMRRRWTRPHDRSGTDWRTRGVAAEELAAGGAERVA
jgi:hypothetical protein